MNAPALPATVEFSGASLSIINRDGQPWLSAADLARALGYQRGDFVTKLFRQHADEFTPGMSDNVESSFSGNLRTQQRIFSPRGCHLIAMFARTSRAKAFRAWVLDVLERLGAPQREIRGSSAGLKALAARFGVTPRTIWAARTRHTYRGVA